jgi:hypothetical protein
VNYLTRVFLGCGVAGRFLICSEGSAVCEGLFFLAGCVFVVFWFQGLEKSLRLCGTFVVRLQQPPA